MSEHTTPQAPTAPTDTGQGDALREAPPWAYAALDAYWTHEGEPLGHRLSAHMRGEIAAAIHSTVLAFTGPAPLDTGRAER